jgi:hypothetical protein
VNMAPILQIQEQIPVPASLALTSGRIRAACLANSDESWYLARVCPAAASARGSTSGSTPSFSIPGIASLGARYERASTMLTSTARTGVSPK